MQTQQVTVHNCFSSYPQDVFVLLSVEEDQSCSISLFIQEKPSHVYVMGEKEVMRWKRN